MSSEPGERTIERCPRCDRRMVPGVLWGGRWGLRWGNAGDRFPFPFVWKTEELGTGRKRGFWRPVTDPMPAWRCLFCRFVCFQHA